MKKLEKNLKEQRRLNRNYWNTESTRTKEGGRNIYRAEDESAKKKIKETIKDGANQQRN